jgi:hypothetical protein
VARGLELFSAARARRDPARFCDVGYAAFTADPVAAVESVYARFGLTLGGRAADATRALGARSAAAGARSAHRYALPDFGLTAGQVNERFLAARGTNALALAGGKSADRVLDAVGDLGSSRPFPQKIKIPAGCAQSLAGWRDLYR